MSQALEGTPQRGLSLTEQANGQRIGRAMFIGHTIGWLLIFCIPVALAAFALFAAPQPGRPAPPPPNVIDLLMAQSPWIKLTVAVVASLIWTDLMVRRRRDRGRSGIDAVVFHILFLALVAIHSFEKAPDLVFWFDLLVGAYGLYLFVVLVLLPGNPVENRYGDVPRPD